MLFVKILQKLATDYTNSTNHFLCEERGRGMARNLAAVFAQRPQASALPENGKVYARLTRLPAGAPLRGGQSPCHPIRVHPRKSASILFFFAFSVSLWFALVAAAGCAGVLVVNSG
jgi:hypothetical protein